jgi:hypothetical protein
MEYYTDDNVERVRGTFSTDAMVSTLHNHGLIDEITGNYSEDVTDMCNNASVILALHLTNVYVKMKDVQVCEGVFNMMGNYTWLLVNGLIFDPTLAQFIPTAPKIAVLKENKYYIPVKQYPLIEWLKNI